MIPRRHHCTTCGHHTLTFGGLMRHYLCVHPVQVAMAKRLNVPPNPHVNITEVDLTSYAKAAGVVDGSTEDIDISEYRTI